MADTEQWVDAVVSRKTVSKRVTRGLSRNMRVRFSKTGVHCYLEDGTVLRKVKGGHKGGIMKGQYEGVDDGDMYDVMPTSRIVMPHRKTPEQ
jgi:hypothetical protein